MSQSCEFLARRIYSELFAATGGRPLQWVALQTLADRLNVGCAALEQAADLGAELGWFEARRAPDPCVCLSDKGRSERL